MPEDASKLVKDKVDEEEGLELGKTAQDYENEINDYVRNANQAAIDNNWKKAEGILKRASIVSKRFFGGQSLEFASVLSKLAAVQETLGDQIASKLTWTKALFIWEINRSGRVKKILPSPRKTTAKNIIKNDYKPFLAQF